jgi:hypothetical protein
MPAMEHIFIEIILFPMAHTQMPMVMMAGQWKIMIMQPIS